MTISIYWRLDKSHIVDISSWCAWTVIFTAARFTFPCYIWKVRP